MTYSNAERKYLATFYRAAYGKEVIDAIEILKSLATIFMSAAFRSLDEACLRVFYRTLNKMNWIKRKSIRNLKRLCESFDRKMNYWKCLVETMSQSIKLM